jgi:linoleoyl-CoA desaturase
VSAASGRVDNGAVEWTGARYAEIAPEVREICRRYGIPYNSGSLPKQFGTVVRKIVKLALPPKDRNIGTKESERVAA